VAEWLKAPPMRGCRKYLLEYQDGEPAFRSADNHPALARDEIELATDRIFDEALGTDIVPQKLAKPFPGPLAGTSFNG
jgi:hypothetical protein